MNEETLKTLSVIVGITLGILGFIWNVIKDWDKVPARAKKFFSIVFRQGTAWVVLLVVSALVAYSIWATQNPAIYPIEKAPAMTSFLYEGARNPAVNQGSGYLGITSDSRDGIVNTSYKLDYDLPKDGNAYAGVALWFPEPVDLSNYNFIELKVSFADDQARFRLFIKDAFNGQDSVTLGDGKIVDAKLQPQTISLPLKTFFPSVAKKSVRELDLDTNNLFTQGKHTFTVSQIQFRK